LPAISAFRWGRSKPCIEQELAGSHPLNLICL
jgi:hypothetical protein